jgi:hypothetical protein
MTSRLVVGRSLRAQLRADAPVATLVAVADDPVAGMGSAVAIADSPIAAAIAESV